MLNEAAIYLSNSYDPAFNLAFEEHLLRTADENALVLFLWQNDKTVVIGRHQNPFKECNLQLMKQDKIKLVRRLSGGGAVYHDLGNLNFTFVGGESHYNVDRQMAVILKSLMRFGIEGKMSGRNDLTVNDHKISGSAFFSHEQFQCHHGTVLVNVDIDHLANYLTVSDLKMRSKGIDSVQSRVVNLASINPEINIMSLKTSIIDAFKLEYGVLANAIEVSPSEFEKAFEPLMLKYNSWDWNYAEGPSFEIEHSAKFDWGIFELQLNLNDGRISTCGISSDCLLTENFKLLEAALIGEIFSSDNIKRIFRDVLINIQLKEDLCLWMDQWLS